MDSEGASTPLTSLHSFSGQSRTKGIKSEFLIAELQSSSASSYESSMPG